MNFGEFSTPDYGNVLGADSFMDSAIHSLWHPTPKIAGTAYTVQLAAGDHLMLHAAIYQAPPQSIIVVDGVDTLSAVAGGNVCTAAKQRGIQGFIIDGVIRDIDEIFAIQFPVYAKGVFPVPGKKNCVLALAQPIVCGGVRVSTGDIIVADSDGIVVIEQAQAAAIYHRAKTKADAEAAMTFDQWHDNHQAKISETIQKLQNK